MSEPFLAEVKIVGFNFAPRGWAFCDGQILPINQNQSLYSLLGTTYGGDGRTTFALPELRGRTPIHVGSSGGADHKQGQKSGEETHALSVGEMAQHVHTPKAANVAATAPSPENTLFAQPSNGSTRYAAKSGADVMRTDMVLNQGGGQGHNNMMPWLALNFCIALRGTFPSRN